MKKTLKNILIATIALIIVSAFISPNIADISQGGETQVSDIFQGYRIIEVAGGDTSGHREANVAVNIGFGNRDYWAFTNEHGQLIKVVADEIILQDDYTEDVNSDGRYYSRMADVPGVGAVDKKYIYVAIAVVVIIGAVLIFKKK